MLLDDMELAEKKEKQFLEGSEPREEELEIDLENLEKLVSYGGD